MSVDRIGPRATIDRSARGRPSATNAKGAGAVSARQNEASQRRQLGFEGDRSIFEALNIGVGHGDFGDAFGDLFGWVGQPRADREQVCLNAFEDLGHFTRKLTLRPYRSKTRVQSSTSP